MKYARTPWKISLASVLLISASNFATPDRGVLAHVNLRQSRSAAQPLRVVVDQADGARIAQLQAQGATLLVDYGAFALWQSTASGAANATSSTAAPSSLDTIWLRGGRYLDTRTGGGLLGSSGSVLPQSGPALATQRRSASVQLWLVQFIGPIKDAWLSQLRQLGATPVAYLPSNAYVVWADGAALDKIDALIAQGSALQWAGPYEPSYRLAPALQAALADNAASTWVTATVQIYTSEQTSQTLTQLMDMGLVVQMPWTFLNYTFVTLHVSASRLPEIAALPDVFNVEPLHRPHTQDERQDQILAGNLIGQQPAGPGYLAWLQGKGVPTDPGAYPIVAVVDDGVDNGTTAPLHPDFYQLGNPANPSRLIFNLNCTTDPAADGGAGHGNLNAGILAGYNAGAQPFEHDAEGYIHGLGVAPFGRIANIKIFSNLTGFDLSQCGNSYSGVVRRAYNNGARLTNNSWGSDDDGAYGIDAFIYDALTRDADTSTPSTEPMLHIFSAGNDGGDSGRPYSIGSPGVGKNVLTVGASENVREPGVLDGCGEGNADSADDLAAFSSRGPSNDGRAKPDLVAPGTHIVGPASQSPNYNASGICGAAAGSADRRFYPSGQITYTWSSGSSHAAPAVAGAAALAYELYGRAIRPAETPSPAMLRALLLNSTRYLSGVGAGDTLPGIGQGWGAIDLSVLYTDTARQVLDQNYIFGLSGQTYTATGNIVDPTRPFRASLAWTDALGAITGNAYVNDLDLTVEVNGALYRGNVFSGPQSVTGGAADSRNNIEQVFLPAGLSGSYILTVTARNIAGNGVPQDLGPGLGDGDYTDQDFALVLLNGDNLPQGSGAITARDVALSRVEFMEDQPSNANGAIDPGERIRMNVALTNRSALELRDVVADIDVTQGSATLLSSTAAYGSIGAGLTVTNATPFLFEIAPTQPCAPLQLTFRAEYNDGLNGSPQQVSLPLFVPIGRQLLSAPQSYTRTESSALEIPDNQESGARSTLTISDAGAALIDSLDVRIEELNHPWTRDLVIRLIAPSGKSARLFNRNGLNGATGSGADLRGLIFDQQVTQTLSALIGPGPYSGAYQPDQTLDVFKNEPLAGNWTLVVQDVSPTYTGTLLSWGLDVRTKVAQCAAVLPSVTPTLVPSSIPTATSLPSTETPNPVATETASPVATATSGQAGTATPAPSSTPRSTTIPRPTATRRPTTAPMPTSPPSLADCVSCMLSVPRSRIGLHLTYMPIVTRGLASPTRSHSNE